MELLPTYLSKSNGHRTVSPAALVYNDINDTRFRCSRLIKCKGFVDIPSSFLAIFGILLYQSVAYYGKQK